MRLRTHSILRTSVSQAKQLRRDGSALRHGRGAGAALQTDAILDRIVHNAYRLALDGPSMRKIQAAGTEAAPPVAVTTISVSTASAKGAKK